MSDLLEVSDLHTRYGHTRVHDGVSLQVADGEVVALLGPNGAGKTTLLSAVAGLLRPHGGRIALAGRDVTRLAPDRVAQAGISLVPEGRRIFASQTVRENLELGAYARRDRSAVASDLERMYELFPILRDKRDQRGGELSGGQQQMLAIARGLMARPRIMLLDEPSLGLSPKLVQEVQAIIRQLRDEVGMAILLVEQNANLALSVSGRGYLMKNGAIVGADIIDRLRDSTTLRELYLGAGDAQ